MFTKLLTKRWVRKLGGGVGLCLGALLVTVTVVFAALYTINTNDSSIAEWGSIGVFQTDAGDDVANDDEDIISARVASGPSGTANTLYFTLQTKSGAATPLNTQYRAAVASIDCDNNGIDQEPQDRLIAYVRSEDQMVVMRGDQSAFFGIAATYGQRVGDTLEWGVPFAELPPDGPGGYDDVDCRHAVRIRFMTADVSQFFPTPIQNAQAILIDQTSPLSGWNLPTAVTLQDFEARSVNPLLKPVAGFVFLAGFVVIGSLFFISKKAKKIT